MPLHLPARACAHPVAAWIRTGLTVAVLGCMAAIAPAQTPKTTDASPAAGKQSISKPMWRDLSARQQRALEPLAPIWDSLNEPHKRKWLAVSRNYASLPDADQAVMHSRMTEWAALSNQARAQARLNFAEVKQVPADERKAKWEAYQALSTEEKNKLAARASPRPGAASAILPVPVQKLAPVPALSPDGQHTPKIQLAPPVTAAAPVAAPAAAARMPTAIKPMAPVQTSPSGPPVSAEAQVPPPAATLPADTPLPSARVAEPPAAAP